jgi:cytochrome c oxidase subunit 3
MPAVIPWTYEPRPDTRTTNVRVGIWLFLASEAMLFASLLSAYVLLRAGASTWPEARTLLDPQAALVNTAVLALATAASVWLSRANAANDSADHRPRGLS